MTQPGSNPDRFLLPEAENRRIFTERIVPEFFTEVRGVAAPSVHVFGGQPGAGKSVIQGAIVAGLAQDVGVGGVLAVIGDDLRGFHPDYSRLLAEDDEAAAFYTDRDSGRWVEQAIRFAIVQRPHVVLEGTLRRPEVTLASARQFTDAGFAAYLHVVAVHRFVSRTRIFGRYAEQLRRQGRGRYTLPAAHDVSYDHLAESVRAIAETGLFQNITLYDQVGSPISTQADPSATRAAIESVQASLPHEDEREVLLDRLDEYDEVLARFSKGVALADLQALRLEIRSSLQGE